jgi:hypothetical protein
MKDSVLDLDFRIGLDEPVKTKKQRGAEKKRQRENLKRYAWLTGKAGADLLKLLGSLLVWTGNKSKVGGTDHRIRELRLD